MLEGIVAGTLAIGGTGLIISLLLNQARNRFPADQETLVETINRSLPQTQCAQCGYPGCRPYAEAIAGGEAINRCPPGGDETIIVLADLLGRDPAPLDPDCGENKGAIRAVIREDECIGCTLCIQACPVDAIIGAAQQMHTVIENECTGCELCLPPCPVDCIDLVALETDGATSGSTRPSSPSQQPALECIRCGACEIACPKDLAPQDLYWYREDEDALTNLNLDQCIECRRCDRVCPSNIPLTASFQTSKASIRERETADANAKHAEMRFYARNQRLARAGTTLRKRPSKQERSALLDAIKRPNP